MLDNNKRFQNIEEWQTFAEAQQQLLIQLNKKLFEKEEEIEHLKKLLSDSTTPLLEESKNKLLNTEEKDEEAICRMELFKLRQESTTRVLTLEEAKKVDIYSKLLISLENKKDPQEREAQALDTTVLLKALEEPKKLNE